MILGNEYRTGEAITVVTPEFGAMAIQVKGILANSGQKPYAAVVGRVMIPNRPDSVIGNLGYMTISGDQEAEPDRWWRAQGYTEFWCEIYLVVSFGGTYIRRSTTPNKDGFCPDIFGPSYPRRWPTVFNWRCKPAGHLFMAEGPAYRVDNKWIGHNQWETMANPQPVIVERPLPEEKPKLGQLQLF